MQATQFQQAPSHSVVDCSENYRILVVDDNEAIHDDFRKILEVPDDLDQLASQESQIFGFDVQEEEPLKFVVDTANQGQIGINKVAQAVRERSPYAMAFVDMRMPPGINGLETIEGIWNVDPSVQIVICSAYSDHTWSEITERLGKKDNLLILKKPFDNVEVLQLALALTEKWNANRAIHHYLELLESTVSDRTRSLNEAIHELKVSRSFLTSTLDSLSTQIAIIDRQGEVVATNASWSEHARDHLFRGRAIETGANYLDACYELNDSDMTSELINSIHGILSEEKAQSSLEFSIETDAGMTRWYRVEITKFYSSDEIHAVIAHDEITEIKNLQGQLTHAQKLEAVGQLAAGVAHEINTPIQFVGDNIRFLQDSFADLIKLLESAIRIVEKSAHGTIDKTEFDLFHEDVEQADVGYLAEEIPTAISQSIEGVNRVAKIVRAMKEFSHPGQKGKVDVDLNRAIESTITVAANEWKYVAEIERDFDAKLPPVPCLAGDLNQVILNLIVNASHTIADVIGDGSQGKGKITVSTSSTPTHAVIRISDTGTGIPKEYQDRIFAPFFTTKEVGKGTGQGLAIAHSIITAGHSGRISFETKQGAGTTFIIELPLVVAADH